MGKRSAVFLDRDGTINIEKNYLYRIGDWEWIPGAMDTIRAFNDAGYLVVVTSNQAGIARGYYSEADVCSLNDFILQELLTAGATIDGFYQCPHHPEFTGNCTCRKPLPGMLLQAADELNIDLSHSWMIGDRQTDIQAAHAAGVRPILVCTGYGHQDKTLQEYPVVCDSIREAGEYIMRSSNKGDC